jgi:hypothetical protein
LGLINHPTPTIKELVHMSDTRTRVRRVSVDDLGTIHYGNRTMTGEVVGVIRFEHGPRAGRVRKIAVRPVFPDHRPLDRDNITCWFVPARRDDAWLSVGGATTLTF